MSTLDIYGTYIFRRMVLLWKYLSITIFLDKRTCFLISMQVQTLHACSLLYIFPSSECLLSIAPVQLCICNACLSRLPRQRASCNSTRVHCNENPPHVWALPATMPCCTPACIVMKTLRTIEHCQPWCTASMYALSSMHQRK